MGLGLIILLAQLSVLKVFDQKCFDHSPRESISFSRDIFSISS